MSDYELNDELHGWPTWTASMDEISLVGKDEYEYYNTRMNIQKNVQKRLEMAIEYAQENNNVFFDRKEGTIVILEFSSYQSYLNELARTSRHCDGHLSLKTFYIPVISKNHYADCSSLQFENVLKINSSIRFHHLEENIQNYIKELNKYIVRVDKITDVANGESRDFSKGLCFFSQGKNRQANYELVKELIRMLRDTNVSIEERSKLINLSHAELLALRKSTAKDKLIFDNNPSDELGINSEQLRAILKLK
jgi:hypothetical protein